MTILDTQLNAALPTFWPTPPPCALVDDLRAQLDKVALGAANRPRQAPPGRQSCCPRARADAAGPRHAVPRNCPAWRRWHVQQRRSAQRGVITGIGRVNGVDCMIVCNDATVKGGTYYPLTVKKHLRAQEIAAAEPAALHLPGGLGRRQPAQPRRSVPRPRALRPHLLQPGQHERPGHRQIAVVMGSCTAGGAYVPAMSDETIIVKNQGTIFLGGPPLVKAATGEVVSAEDLGGGDVHTRLSGVADHWRKTTCMRLQLPRTAVRNLNKSKPPAPAAKSAGCPGLQQNELYGMIPTDTRKPFDVREIIARIVDGSEFDEFKPASAPRWSPALRTSRACLSASSPTTASVQRVGPEGRALHRAVLPAQDSAGVPAEHHRLHGGPQVRERGHCPDGAKMVTAVATANVPKFTIIIGGSFGAGNYGMCGRAYCPRFLWMWPNARISVMGGEQAAVCWPR